jgi:hypothetical protein
MVRTVKGKKLSKITHYSIGKEGDDEFINDHNSSFETFEQQILRNKRDAEDLLISRGHDPLLPHHYYKKKFGHDSVEGLASEVIFHIGFMMSEIPLMDRLKHAVFLGKASVLIQVYLPQIPVQSKNAQQERKKGLTNIFNILRAQKNEGAKPKDLWPTFISMLREDKENFDQVKEISANPKNCKSWCVNFIIVPNKDSDSIKDDKMTYARFTRRLNMK